MGTATLTTADNASSPWSGYPANTYLLMAESFGAGGGGGGSRPTTAGGGGGGGGGGGAYAKKSITNPTGSYAFSVGAGGSTATATDGGNGGTSWFVSNDSSGC